MQNFKHTFFFSLAGSFLCFTFTNCETVIEVPLPKQEPAITLNGIFSVDTTFNVVLTENRSILDSSPGYDPIPNATVQLFAGGMLIGEMTETENPGYYQLNVIPQAGIKYQITAVKEGFAQVESSDIIPDTEVNATILGVEEKKDNSGSIAYHLTYNLEDPPGEDFYDVRLYKLTNRYDYYYDEDTAYFYFVKEVHYNLVGAELNEFEDYGSNNLFSDELFDTHTREVTVEFYDYQEYNPTSDEGDAELADTSRLLLQIRHVSEGYYRYKVTRQLQSETKYNPFAEPTTVYNNIENGYGIFAGYNSTELEFEIVYKNE